MAFINVKNNVCHDSFLNYPFSKSWEECFLGYEEPSSSKHHYIGVGEQFCFCIQQGQSKLAFQHVCLSNYSYIILYVSMYIYFLFVSCVGPMFSSNDHVFNVAWIYIFFLIDTWNFLCTGLSAFSISQAGSS